MQQGLHVMCCLVVTQTQHSHCAELAVLEGHAHAVHGKQFAQSGWPRQMATACCLQLRQTKLLPYFKQLQQHGDRASVSEAVPVQEVQQRFCYCAGDPHADLWWLPPFPFIPQGMPQKPGKERAASGKDHHVAGHHLAIRTRKANVSELVAQPKASHAAPFMVKLGTALLCQSLDGIVHLLPAQGSSMEVSAVWKQALQRQPPRIVLTAKWCPSSQQGFRARDMPCPAGLM